MKTSKQLHLDLWIKEQRVDFWERHHRLIPEKKLLKIAGGVEYG
jgi:hypothetical protein